MKKHSEKNKGFSLVELIIVVAIMAILMGVMAPQYLRYVEKAKIRTDDAVIDAIYEGAMNALMSPTFHNKVDTLPTVKILQGGLIEISGMVSSVPDANELLKTEIYASVYGVTEESEIKNPFTSNAYKKALSNGNTIDLSYAYDAELMTFGIQVDNAPKGSRFYSETE